MKTSKERLIIIEISKIPFNRLLSVLSVLSVHSSPYIIFFQMKENKKQYISIC